MTLIPNNLSIIGEKNCLTSLIAACPTAQRQAQNCLGFFSFFSPSTMLYYSTLQTAKYLLL